MVLISGGGSALLTLPQSPITLEDVLTVTKALGAEGATITQLNMMRRHLSLVKGTNPAQEICAFEYHLSICKSLLTPNYVCIALILSSPLRWSIRPDCRASSGGLLDSLRRFGGSFGSHRLWSHRSLSHHRPVLLGCYVFFQTARKARRLECKFPP